MKKTPSSSPLKHTIAVLAFLILLATSASAESEPTMPHTSDQTSENLAVLWTSADPDVAHRIVFLYTNTAKRKAWFQDITLIIWGPSQRLLVADKEIQAYVQRIQESGVTVEACVNCAESYGIADEIRALDIAVKPMGLPLTEFLKSPQWEVLTF